MPDLPMADRHETILPPAAPEVLAALETATAASEGRRDRLAAVAASHPGSIDAWVALAPEGRDATERYAYARVGYHRGLDALRGAGWGGRGYVRWSQPNNRAFLTGLVRLRDAAREVGEDAEVVRLDGFLVELDPDWDERHVTG